MVVCIAVGSKNPVKINAARVGSARALRVTEGEVSVEGYDVPSGVRDQPLSDEETRRGATTRCTAAFEAHLAKHGVAPDFAVGLEGGVMISLSSASSTAEGEGDGERGRDLECFAWMVVYDGRLFGKARTGAFVLPPVIRDLILVEKMELGEADDRVFKTINSKHKGGSVGQFTNGVLDRAAYYEHAIILAYIPFNYRQLYGNDDNNNIKTSQS